MDPDEDLLNGQEMIDIDSIAPQKKSSDPLGPCVKHPTTPCKCTLRTLRDIHNERLHLA